MSWTEVLKDAFDSAISMMDFIGLEKSLEEVIIDWQTTEHSAFIRMYGEEVFDLIKKYLQLKEQFFQYDHIGGHTMQSSVPYIIDMYRMLVELSNRLVGNIPSKKERHITKKKDYYRGGPRKKSESHDPERYIHPKDRYKWTKLPDDPLGKIDPKEFYKWRSRQEIIKTFQKFHQEYKGNPPRKVPKIGQIRH